jgi:uncharacterized protein (TIGR02145 family)
MPEVHTQVGLTYELVPVFTPHDATNRNLTWTSSDEDVVTVDNAGLVTAVGTRIGLPTDGYRPTVGGFITGDSAYITVVTTDGGHTDASLFRVFRFFEDGCNDAVSGGSFFGGAGLPPFEGLGETPFNPNNTVVIGSQEWSPPVQGCTRIGRTTNNFTGITSAAGGSFNADCRENFSPSIDGALYSWCAVVRFGHLMCPPALGWRVPTAEDFAILDQAIRDSVPGQEFRSGTESYVSLDVVDEFVRVWRANFSGMITTGQNANTPAPAGISGRGVFGAYWSQTEHSHTGAYFFYIGSRGQISPQDTGVKSAGRTVRCVRDWPRQ